MYQSRQLLFIWLSFFYLKTTTIPRNTNGGKKTKTKTKQTKKRRGVRVEEFFFSIMVKGSKHESNLALIVYSTLSSRLRRQKRKKKKGKRKSKKMNPWHFGSPQHRPQDVVLVLGMSQLLWDRHSLRPSARLFRGAGFALLGSPSSPLPPPPPHCPFSICCSFRISRSPRFLCVCVLSLIHI